MAEPARALITGASGFIGTHLATALCERGVEVTCLSRRPLPHLPDARVLVVPTWEPEHVRQALQDTQAEIVFHLAAAGVSPKDRSSRTLLRGNAELVATLLEAVADWPLTHFVHTGSCWEYAPITDETPIGERHAIRPMSLYGAAKASSVLVADAVARQHHIPLVVLRLFGVYGPGEAPARLLPTLLARLRAGQPTDLTLGEQHQDYTFVEDIVEAYLIASQRPVDGVYNVCSGRPVRVRDVALQAAAVVGADPALLRFGARPYRLDHPRWIVGDPTRFATATGWSATTPLAAGIRRMLDD